MNRTHFLEFATNPNCENISNNKKRSLSASYPPSKHINQKQIMTRTITIYAPYKSWFSSKITQFTILNQQRQELPSSSWGSFDVCVSRIMLQKNGISKPQNEPIQKTQEKTMTIMRTDHHTQRTLLLQKEQIILCRVSCKLELSHYHVIIGRYILIQFLATKTKCCHT